MTFLTWNSAWETGIQPIDEQHRQLLAQFEALLVAIRENHPELRIPRLLTFLSDYVETHFSKEEDHMKGTRYPGFIEHKAIHDGMRAHVAHMVADYHKDPASMTEQVLEFLTDWLISHINDHDRRMAHHLLRFDGLEPKVAR
jgi:hemerythrin-like metal-binding protein